MIICFILTNKQLTLCGECKENLHSDQPMGLKGLTGQKYFNFLSRHGAGRWWGWGGDWNQARHVILLCQAQKS